MKTWYRFYVCEIKDDKKYGRRVFTHKIFSPPRGLEHTWANLLPEAEKLAATIPGAYVAKTECRECGF
jgi:hypothetical protein